jgi:hypothetical protein
MTRLRLAAAGTLLLASGLASGLAAPASAQGGAETGIVRVEPATGDSTVAPPSAAT